MGYHSLEARKLAVLVWCLSGGVIATAIDQWAQHGGGTAHADVKDVRGFIQRWGERFLEEGNVENKPHHPDTHKVSDADAKLAAQALKGGYIGWRKPCTPGAEGQMVHMYWTSINRACKENPVLKTIIDKCNVSPAHLLKRMHEVDPNLKYIKLDYKMDLTPAQKRARQGVAAQLLERVHTVPNFLNRVVWIDEASVWLVSKKMTDIHVYADAHDERVKQVIHVDGLKPGTKIKVRCLCAVNALTGPLFIEFMTGTTDVHRVRLDQKKVYLVS